jgi:hypothetical protein
MARSDVEVLNAEIKSYCSFRGIAAWERIRAKYIKKEGRIVRAKHPAQQHKTRMPSCDACEAMCDSCGNGHKRGTIDCKDIRRAYSSIA